MDIWSEMDKQINGTCINGLYIISKYKKIHQKSEQSIASNFTLIQFKMHKKINYCTIQNRQSEDLIVSKFT